MKKAIQIAYDALFKTKCEIASRVGFRHIAVNFNPLPDKTEAEWERMTEDILRILSENQLSCVQTHPYYYDLRLSSEICKDGREFAIKQAVIASGKLGAKWCTLHPRTSLSTGRYRLQSQKDNEKKIEEYLTLAEKYDTGIAVENLPIFDGIVPVMPFYSHSYDDLALLVDGFNSSRVGICWDTGHANMMDFDQAEAVLFLGARIKCTHIHNNFKYHDSHLSPENGDIPWEKVMSAFAEVGYEGPLTLETHCPYNDDALLESFARHNLAGLEYLERLMKKV